MEIKIPIHSVIDVITNSSTEIFTFVKDNAVELCHEAINEILKVSGSDKKSEDLFDVYIEPDLDYLNDTIIDHLLDCNEDDEVYLKFKDKLNEYDNMSWDTRDEKYELNEKLSDEIISYLQETGKILDYANGNQTFVRIKSKDSSISNKDIYRIFDSATYEEERSC